MNEIQINTILNGTPSYMIGTEIIEYANVYVMTFDKDGKEYTINAVFDTETDVKALVVANSDDIIINKL